MPRTPGVTESSRTVVDHAGGNLTLDLMVLDQHLGALLDVAFTGAGITPAQYAVYAELSRGSRTPRQLIETLGLRPATLTGYLNAMTERGHVDRSPHTTDGRSSVLSLTTGGREQFVVGRDRLNAARRSITTQLGGAEAVGQVRLVLGRVDDALLAAVPAMRRKYAG
ncbi:MarR family winged helix-turn-helix transcriptional regulator [Nocardioides sp. C4-1]|uniref:MarR family winged helix-turn-helix transcriptional regulator n=1 Tax=Nocardioides sp. C4-1 TaxID=3151851 RepID=UPI003262F461